MPSPEQSNRNLWRLAPELGLFFLSTLDVNMQLGLRTSIVEVLIQGLGVRPGTVCCE